MAFFRHLEKHNIKWDVFYLGYGKGQKEPVKDFPGISKLSMVLSTHAYFVNGHLFEKWLQKYEPMKREADNFIREYAKDIYGLTEPNRVIQHPGFSYIRGAVREKEDLHEWYTMQDKPEFLAPAIPGCNDADVNAAEYPPDLTP